mgnify:CR=1 FL=1
MELKDKVALVTGGAQGIGKIVGEELARQGAHVILGDVNLEGAKKSADEYIHRHIEDEEYDWEDNYDEWNYAFWESL